MHFLHIVKGRRAKGVAYPALLNEGATRRFKVSVKNSSYKIDYRAGYC